VTDQTHRKFAARRLLQARAAYERAPDDLRLARAYERALERWRALDNFTKPTTKERL
jgi:hypothetical protein